MNDVEMSKSQDLPPTKAASKPSKDPNADAINLPYRKQVADFYAKPVIQYFVAFVIIFNFCAIVLEKEIDPYPSDVRRHKLLWNTIDDVCNVIFLFELIINMYGSFWRPFIRRGWNYLDFVVVVVGVISLLRIPLPNPVDKIKVLRAFRILRLFKRVKSLNQILVALVNSIPGVMNAFAVMLIVMAIFAIIAVEAFRGFGQDGYYTTVQTYGAYDAVWGQGENMTWEDGQTYVTVESTTDDNSAMTARGFHYGQEYFGTFFRSLYTLFQVLTGESWSEAVVRPLLFGAVPNNALGVGVFWTLYILLTQVVLQNVVVAVLLDKFTQADGSEGEEEEEGEDKSEEAAKAVPAAPTGPVDEASVRALQADFDRVVAEQAKLKQSLAEILTKLQEKKNLSA